MKHTIFNLIGNPDPICESQNHNWKIMWLMDRQYRFCLRCDRVERRVDGNNVSGAYWEVNEIKPSIA